jgi:hypothetical protein
MDSKKTDAGEGRSTHETMGYSGGRRIIRIDDVEYVDDDPVQTGRKILTLAGKRPADEYIVYFIGPDNVLEDLGLDRTLDIREHGVECFLTFRSDRSFRFELNGKREEWGAGTISEETLRKLAGVGPDHRVWLERTGEVRRVLARGEFVDLTVPGIERFLTESALIVTVVNEDNGDEFTLEGDGETKVGVLILRMYEALKVERRPDDRLRCENGGGDIFSLANLTLDEYVKHGHCRCLVWLFAGGTGGAHELPNAR